MIIKRKEVQEIEDELGGLQDEFTDLMQQVSEVRKKGKDTRIAEMKALEFAPTLKMAKVTYDKDDIERVKRVIKRVKDELEEVREGSDMDNTYALIQEAYEHLRNGDVAHALTAYTNITRLYPRLTPDQKRMVYSACIDIQEKIAHHGK
ncbi:hypothetical protein J4460_05625 [Candidatus Woesearchaeota archaeon]|nr:MAG: hypothetical protein QS99_C0015G0042 [archaeon GW2011_AR4]MBS3130126.1 hypothetical protein [Candidatus Woesearchaeota archaeon]HIH38743.1 hypothetical protein [Candidatus Woesearchaeota archaeon]HIH48086.1 hypothetical protein [Candidatus Woesearchaeota archaeon]HIJ04274.1 hypothetical protein [Candidatus Woesearchaeota archaeon]